MARPRPQYAALSFETSNALMTSISPITGYRGGLRGIQAKRVSVTCNLATVHGIKTRSRDPRPRQTAARSEYELCLGTVIIHITGME